MARQKTQQRSNNADIEHVYEKEIIVNCPNRGPVKQKIKVTRFKTPETKNSACIVSNDMNALDIIESKENGLEIYGIEEEAD